MTKPFAVSRGKGRVPQRLKSGKLSADGGAARSRALSNKIDVLRAAKLNGFSWLVHGFSTRLGGFSGAYGDRALNLGFTKDDSKAAVERNRAALLDVVDAGQPGKFSRRSLITLRQIHSDVIHLVESVPEAQLVGDGLITATPGLLLGIQAADCLPIILVDAKRRAVGVFHAGWRGTVKRIVEKGVGEMHRHFGSNPGNLLAAIGPGVQGCCYEVGEEVRAKFEAQFAYASSLFRQGKESDPVREKYPLLFLCACAPGQSDL